MNGSLTGPAGRIAHLERRVRALSFVVGVVGIVAIASCAVGLWHAYDAREARKNVTFSKRKIEYLESRLNAHTAQTGRQFLALKRQLEATQVRVRLGELTAVRRWLSQDRGRIKDLERRLAALEDSLQVSRRGG